MALDQLDNPTSAKLILQVPDALSGDHLRPLTAGRGPPAGPHLGIGHGQSDSRPTVRGVRGCNASASASADWSSWILKTNQSRAKLEELRRKRQEEQARKLAAGQVMKGNGE